MRGPRPSIPALILTVAAASGPAAAPGAAAPGAAAPGGPLAPFSAQYTADWKSIHVGASSIELQAQAPGAFLYTWTVTAHGVFRMLYSDDVVQKSWFSVFDGEARPDHYHATQGAASADLAFDWVRHRAHGAIDGRAVDLALDAGTQDVMSIQIEVMLDLARGHLPSVFRIIDSDEIKEFLYTEEAPARLHTALGLLDTRVVSSRRAGSDRTLRMWFAPALGFVPVQAERFRNGRSEFALRIKSLSR